MPWRKPRKKEERGGKIWRSPEETIEAAFEDEELSDAVELAELEGAAIDEVATQQVGESASRSGTEATPAKTRCRLTPIPAMATTTATESKTGWRSSDCTVNP